MQDLSDVTLVSVTGVDVDATHAAMLRCLDGISFGQAVLIAPDAPNSADDRIEYRRTGAMDYHGYSRFILKDLVSHISTSHALIVQADGFVLNPGRWNRDWLQFDYIGSPFPSSVRVGPYSIEMPNRVGNGGFSLRSRRLLEAVSPIRLETMRYPTKNEDMVICHLLYDYLVSKGMRFADIETAADFAIDGVSLGRTLATTFGFHGKHHLASTTI